MRKIEKTTQFRRDYKRERKGKYKNVLETLFLEVLVGLANDQELAEKHRDHALSGNWNDHRDCHIKPDEKTLQLVRLGSHSELSI